MTTIVNYLFVTLMLLFGATSSHNLIGRPWPDPSVSLPSTLPRPSSADAGETLESFSWSARYESSDEWSISGFHHGVKATSDEGLIVAGYDFGNNASNGSLVKFDSKGVPQWRRTYSPTPDQYDYLFVVEETRDEGFIAAGWTYRFPDNGHDTWVIRVNSEGVPIWENAYRIYGTIYRYSLVWSIIEAQDGGFLLAGYGYGGSNRDAAFVIKLRDDGSVAWHKLWGNPYESARVSSIVELQNGNIAIGGSSEHRGFVAMLGSDGRLLWQNAYSGTPGAVSDMVENSDGTLAVVGAVYDLEYDPQYGNMYPVALDGLVMKLSSENGAIIWQRTYGGNGDEWIGSVMRSVGDRLFLSGSTDSFGNGSFDYWLAEIQSANGAILWQKSYGSEVDERAISLTLSHDNHLVIAGFPNWILKVTRTGACTICNLENVTQMQQTNRTLSGRSSSVTDRATTVYIVPFSSTISSAGVSMRLACPDVLDVGLFLQESEPWRSDPLGSPPDDPDDTIGNLGCYMTSAAMVVNYYAAQQGVGSRTDPRHLNHWLRSEDKYSGDSFFHPTAAEFARLLSIEMYAPNPWRLEAPNDDFISTAIRSGRPVILEVNASSASGRHFVVAVGETTIDGQRTFILNDSVYGFTTLKDRYSNHYVSIRAYDPVRPSDLRSVTISAHSPVEIVVEDAWGRRSGYDPTTGITWNQIPGSMYYDEPIAGQDGGAGGVGTEAAFLYIPNPIEGDYTVTVFGTDSGEYQINAQASNRSGHTTKRTYDGLASNGSMESMVVTYDSETGWGQPYRSYLPLIIRR